VLLVLLGDLKIRPDSDEDQLPVMASEECFRFWLRSSTAVDKTVFQCTKFWIEKEAPMWVVGLVSPEGIGIIGVFWYLF